MGAIQMNTSRNDLCPCGSGKKYKNCCMNKKNSPVDLFYRRLSETYNRLLDKLIDFAERQYGFEMLSAGIMEFFLWTDPDYIDQHIEDFESLFIPWFLFNWIYDPTDIPMELVIPPYLSIAEHYKRKKGNKLDTLEKQIIDASVNQPYSFFEVISSNPGHGFWVKNILSGEELEVTEKMGSQKVGPGDILFANFIKIKDLIMMIGCGKYIIPIGRKPMIIDLRRKITKLRRKVTNRLLMEYQIEIRELLFEIVDTLIKPPVMCNTDGDPLLFHKIHYKIEDPNETFNALRHLCTVESPEELKERAILDNNGNILKIEFPWISQKSHSSEHLKNAVLGHIFINKQRMIIEVNSRQRAKRVRHEVEARLGNKATYKTTEITSLESLTRHPSTVSNTTFKKNQDIMRIPEVRRQMEDFMTQHWKQWMNEKIPALGGKTPKQAVRTPDGRESVEALLMDAEQGVLRDKEFGEFQLKCIQEVRDRLGLNRSIDEILHETRKEDKKAEGKILGMIKDFGKKYLDAIHTELALTLCKKITETPELSLSRGRPEIWASSIIYTICQINFLFDPTQEPHISKDEIFNFFNTKKSTVSSKALTIRRAFDLTHGDYEFCNQKIKELFSIYETGDGFLSPGFMMNEDTQGDENIFYKDKKNPPQT